MEPLRIPIQKQQLIGGRGGGKAPINRAFIAYRMNDTDSCAMREELDRELTRRNVEALDGRLDGGEEWAPTIRKRIERSKVVVADVTGPSREVLFEMGVAARKTILPIVKSRDNFSAVPNWISTVQMLTYKSGSKTPGVAQRVQSMLTTGNLRPTGFQRRSPVPGTVLWLHGHDVDWADRALERLKNMCEEYGTTLKVVDAADLSSPEDLRDLLSSWLVCVTIDGGAQDYLAHYLLGDVVARQKAGAGSRAGESLKRTAVVVTEGQHAESESQWVADAVDRVSKSVISRATPETLPSIVRGRLTTYRSWLLRTP